MSGNIDRMLERREELPTGQVAPVTGTGAPPTTALGALSEGDRASGSRVEPDASLVHATLGSPMQDGNVRANASVLSGAGLDGPAGPGVGATGVTGAANAAGAAPAVTGSGPAAGGRWGSGGQRPGCKRHCDYVGSRHGHLDRASYCPCLG